MRLGAQVYSVRTMLHTPQGYLQAMKQLKAIGYETVQHAGPDIADPYLLRDMTREAGLQQICPNINAQPLLEDADSVIRTLQVLGCDSFMLPYVTPDDFATPDSFISNWAALEAPIRKLQDAGITPVYHNHDFDIAPMGGCTDSFVDYLYENRPGWKFILDVCWSEVARADTVAYLEKLADRLDCVHFKDCSRSMNSKHVPVFTACGAGIVPLEAFANKVKELGIQDVVVEQDNAIAYPDPMEQMAQSAAYLRKLF